MGIWMEWISIFYMNPHQIENQWDLQAIFQKVQNLQGVAFLSSLRQVNSPNAIHTGKAMQNI